MTVSLHPSKMFSYIEHQVLNTFHIFVYIAVQEFDLYGGDSGTGGREVV